MANKSIAMTIMNLLESLDYKQLQQTLERGIEMEKLEREISTGANSETSGRIANACVFLSCLYALAFQERRE